MLFINENITLPSQSLQFSYARSPGPGGQNVNKVNSKAILKWSLENSPEIPEPIKLRFAARYKNRMNKEGFVIISSHKYRDQERNVADCLEKLKQLILSVVPEPVIRKRRKISKAANQRRIESKKQNSQKKQARDFRRED